MEITIPYYDDNTRVSNSAIGWFLESPKYYKDKLDGKIATDPTPAMENGTMTHMYLLQIDEFRERYKILDFETPASAQQKAFCKSYIDSTADKPILRAVEAFKENYSTKGKSDDKIESESLEIALKLKKYIKWLRADAVGTKTISYSKLNRLRTIKELVMSHKKANELLYKQYDSPEVTSINEFHINWEMKTKSGVSKKCKSLIDRLIIDNENKIITLCDIKTTISTSGFGKSFKEYDYGRQLAFYWGAIFWYFENVLKVNIEEYSHNTYIIAISNNDGNVRVFSIPDSLLEIKFTEIKQIITEIDWHETNNLWDYRREYYDGDGSEPLPYDTN